MADCAICLRNDVPVSEPVHAYTAIEETARVKTGFKEYTTRTRTFEPQHHVYHVCAECARKYQNRTHIVWGVAAVLVIFVSILAMDDPRTDAFFTSLVCISLPIVLGAYFVNKEWVSAKGKISEHAVKEREKTNYKNSPALLLDFDPKFMRAQKDVKIIPLSASKYDDVKKKIAGNQ